MFLSHCAVSPTNCQCRERMFRKEGRQEVERAVLSSPVLSENLSNCGISSVVPHLQRANPPALGCLIIFIGNEMHRKTFLA